MDAVRPRFSPKTASLLASNLSIPRSSPVQKSHLSPLPAYTRHRFHRLFAGIKALEATSRGRISVTEMKPRRSCELCEGDAAVYCEPDSAFLCWACDSAVHGANFLAARHVRWVTCSECRSLDAGRRISGAGSLPIRSICRSCEPDLASSPSSTSSCLSSTESTAAPAKQGERKPLQRRRRRRRSSGGRRRTRGRWVSRRAGPGE